MEVGGNNVQLPCSVQLTTHMHFLLSSFIIDMPPSGSASTSNDGRMSPNLDQILNTTDDGRVARDPSRRNTAEYVGVRLIYELEAGCCGLVLAVTSRVGWCVQACVYGIRSGVGRKRLTCLRSRARLSSSLPGVDLFSLPWNHNIHAIHPHLVSLYARRQKHPGPLERLYTSPPRTNRSPSLGSLMRGSTGVTKTRKAPVNILRQYSGTRTMSRRG